MNGLYVLMLWLGVLISHAGVFSVLKSYGVNVVFNYEFNLLVGYNYKLVYIR